MKNKYDDILLPKFLAVSSRQNSPKVKYLFLKASYSSHAGDPSSLLLPLNISKSSLKYGIIIHRLIDE